MHDRALGQIGKQRPELGPNSVMVELGQLLSLALQETTHRDIRVEKAPQPAVILEATEALRRYGPH